MFSDFDITWNYLTSGSHTSLPSSCQKLRSYFNLHLADLAEANGINVFHSFTKTNLICPKCILPWTSDTYSLKLLPGKKHKKRPLKIKGVPAKAYLGKEVKANHLILKCKICNSRCQYDLWRIAKKHKLHCKKLNKIVQKKKKRGKKEIKRGKKSYINSCPKNLKCKRSKKNRKLLKLQKIVQEHKKPVRKSLKDFLVLI